MLSIIYNTERDLNRDSYNIKKAAESVIKTIQSNSTKDSKKK